MPTRSTGARTDVGTVRRTQRAGSFRQIDHVAVTTLGPPMPSSPSIVERAVNRVQRATSLDAVSERLAGLLRKVIRPGPVEDVLSGTPLGHPLHPVLVSLQIGACVSASVL